MSVQIRTSKGTDCVQEKGYSIRPVRPTFTDWDGGQAVSQESENRSYSAQLDRATLEMGNETEICYDEEKHSPPSESVVFCDKNLYERLRAHNRDTWWQYREDSTISKDIIADFKEYLIFAFSSEVGLNSLQKQRAFSRFMELDLKRGTGRTEVNAFVVCCLVANKDAEQYGSEKIYHPQRLPENNDKEFQRLEEALKSRFRTVTESTLTKVYNKISQGNPPTRQPSKWRGKVRRKSVVPYNLSDVTDQYDPREEI